ncbi:MAG: hypothetical protein ACRD04_13245 [Terriglobales bacterium]
MERLEAPPGAEAWAELDREWSQFWASLEAHAHDPAAWFTPAHTSQLQRLLERGSAWRLEAVHAHEERTLYACHLRRLEPVLRQVQAALGETAEQLLNRREQLQHARDWAGSQVGPRTRVRR